ncbi:MAG: hydantoinase/oxoprolinase family protein [Gammaproteobacteria bacterium]|nr:hydantoinase/oxoprolinase family protein [Gammaproteobacteria bacterium]
MTESSKSVRLAVDVGGTFTDIVALDLNGGGLRFDKVPTTPAMPSQGVLDSFERAQVDADRVSYFVHGTTLGLNALLTRSGANTAIVTTEGFRDVYLLGRTDRVPMYDFKYKKPESLVPRHQIFEVPERMNYQGEVLRPFDVDSARKVARQIQDLGLEAVAVCFLHSYANPEHELLMKDMFQEVAPGLEVTISHELTREYREYERLSTAVLDGYIKPVVRKYIGLLEDALDEGRFDGHFLMTRSGGGAMTAGSAKESPVNLILSGPAGGVIGAAWFAAVANEPNLITIDMGGTSLDASLIIDESAVLLHEAVFEGLPITIPSLYINTIGAGGGSKVWIDDGGHLQVGPQSAGADPGPAAYGRGGTDATFTDAALKVGYLGSDHALAGTLRLDEGLAEQALEPSASALGLSVDQVALGVIQIAVTKIVGAVRGITVELGHNPRDFTLLAFGGGGGLVAVDVAKELSIPRVVIPPGPGAFSAFGMLMANVQHDFSRTRVTLLEEADPGNFEQQFSDMMSEAQVALSGEGFGPDRRQLLRFMDLRYLGQEHSVSIPVGSKIDEAEIDRIQEAFALAHERQYGHAMTDPVEVVTLRLQALGVVERPVLREIEPNRGAVKPFGERQVYRASGSRVPYSLYEREELRQGARIEGPAVISEHTATTVIHEGDVAVVGPYGELQITVAREEEIHG